MFSNVSDKVRTIFLVEGKMDPNMTNNVCFSHFSLFLFLFSFFSFLLLNRRTQKGQTPLFLMHSRVCINTFQNKGADINHVAKVFFSFFFSLSPFFYFFLVPFFSN